MRRTQVWRDMEGVTTYQSVSDADWLAMNTYISCLFDFTTEQVSYHCYYTISGDRIATFVHSDLSLVVEWFREKTIEEIIKNRKALEKDGKEYVRKPELRT